MDGQRKRLGGLSPLQVVPDGADPAQGERHPKIMMTVRDVVIRPDGSKMELSGPTRDKPVACPSCHRPVSMTREFAGPGALPIRDGVLPFIRKSPVTWGGEYAPPQERGYSTSPAVPARRRILGDGPCGNCRYWRAEISAGRLVLPQGAAGPEEVHEVFFHVCQTFTNWRPGAHRLAKGWRPSNEGRRPDSAEERMLDDEPEEEEEGDESDGSESASAMAGKEDEDVVQRRQYVLYKFTAARGSMTASATSQVSCHNALRQGVPLPAGWGAGAVSQGVSQGYQREQ